MGVTVDATKYGELLARTRPKVIADDEEFDRMVALLEELDFADRQLEPEEEALRDLVAKLVAEYDDRRHPLPDLPPHRMVAFLLEQRGLRQADLAALLGSRSQVSDIVRGRRGVSKTQARKLSEFFRVPADLFL